MSVANFCRLVNEGKLGKNDKEWFPRWIRRYASGVKVVQGNLPVSREEVIRFLRSLLGSQTPAWQRLQAVRAIEAYRNLVLQTEVPSAGGYPAEAESAGGPGAGHGCGSPGRAG